LTTLFDRAFDDLLGIEGEYSNDPADRGGATQWGVTEFLARAYKHSGPMTALSKATAKRIYRAEFWQPLRLTDIGRIDPALALELFEAAVNCSPQRAAEWLQRGLNLLNDGGRHYADIVVDGRIGPQTLQALRALVLARSGGADTLRVICNVLQGNHYITLAERSPSQERFVFGWVKNRVTTDRG
jgi:lysozyme family protein